MNKKIITPLDLVELIDDHNSLLLRYKTGRIMYFEDMKTMYKTFLAQLKKEFPKGYIETEHYVIVHYDLTFVEASSWLANNARRRGLQQIYVVNWEELDSSDFNFLKGFVGSIHDLLGTLFILEAFTEAFNEVRDGIRKAISNSESY